MSRYDLLEYRKLPWVRYVRVFRVAFAVFLVAVSVWVALGVLTQAVNANLDSIKIVGSALIFMILGLFLFVVSAMRPPAISISIDQSGVRLEFRRGPPDLRTWSGRRTKFRGRYTTGASDSISNGHPLWSVYGRFGGLTESFIPGSAFRELVSEAEGHGFRRREWSGRPGWVLYALDV